MRTLRKLLIVQDLATVLGGRIRELRRKKGFSQESFADHCGLHRTYMGGIERGEDARAILDAGADLVQIYTAFIYRGPFAARAIARELLQLTT